MKCVNNKWSFTVDNGQVLIILLLAFIRCASCAPFVEAGNDDDDDRVQSTVVSNFTQFGDRYDSSKDVVSKVLNMSDTGIDDYLAKFNVSKADIIRKVQEQIPPHSQTPVLNDSAALPVYDELLVDPHTANKTQIINTYLGHIQTALNRTSIIDETYHNIAFYPVCSKNNATTWTAENTAKLYFSSTMFNRIDPHVNLESAILSLRQIGQRRPVSCSEPEELIHVTVSVMIRRNGGDFRMKKHICQSFSTPRLYSGWKRVDVRQVILHWQKAHRLASNSNRSIITDPMLAIDVLDQNANPLKAGTFFEPTDCQASAASPWSFAERDDLRDIHPSFSLPNCPRLDIRYTSHSHHTHALAKHNMMQHILAPLQQLRHSRLQPSVIGQQSEQQNHQFMSAASRDSTTVVDLESAPLPAYHNRQPRARTHAQVRYHSAETTN